MQIQHQVYRVVMEQGVKGVAPTDQDLQDPGKT